MIENQDHDSLDIKKKNGKEIENSKNWAGKYFQETSKKLGKLHFAYL